MQGAVRFGVVVQLSPDGSGQERELEIAKSESPNFLGRSVKPLASCAGHVQPMEPGIGRAKRARERGPNKEARAAED